MANNPYNQPNAVATAGFKTYNAKDVKAGKINPYEDYGLSTRSKALSEQKLYQADEAATEAKTRAAEVASQVAQQKADAAAKPKAPPKPAAPKETFLNKVGDVFKANTPQDQAKRTAASQPAQFKEQQQQKKDASQRAKDFNFNNDELTARRDFYQQNGVNVDDALKQKKVADDFKTKYKGQSLAHLTLTNNPDLKAAQQWEKTKKQIDTVEKKFNDANNPEIQREKGIVRGAANVGGGLIAVPAEAINEKIVKPFVSSPSGALGSALADATSGKGFDFRKRYQEQQHEPNVIKQGAEFVDKKAGTHIAPAVDYADQHPVEALVTTGLVAADIASDGLLTPFIAPTLTAYYGGKYVKDLPQNLKAIQNEKDPSKKFEKGTETILGGLLLAKGAHDTVATGKGVYTDIKGGVDAEGNPIRGTNFKTEKTTTQKNTVPNEQARSFFNSPNPDLPPETSSLLAKALADNKKQFVTELKGGKGITVEQTATVPTTYGKLIEIIRNKVRKGEKLTPNEEGVVQTVSNDPQQFVKTVTSKDLIKHDPNQPEQPVVVPPPQIIELPQQPPAVQPAPDLAPIDLPTGLAHPDNIVNTPAAVAPTVEAPQPKGALKPLKQPTPHPASHLADERAHQSGHQPFVALDELTQSNIDKLVTRAQNKAVPTGHTRLYQTNDSPTQQSDQYFKDIDMLANYVNGRSDNSTLRMVDVPNNEIETMPGKPEVFKIREVPAKPKGSLKPSNYARGEAEAAKLKESDVTKEVDRKLAKYAEGKADLAAFTRHIENMGGTFGDFHGSYNTSTAKQGTVTVELRDGRKFTFKMSDVFDRLKKPSESTATKEYKTIHEDGVKTVKGEPVDIVPGVETFVHPGDGGWIVSEATTGRFLAESRTKEAAIAKAKSAVNDVGLAKFKQLLKDNKLKDTEPSKATAKAKGAVKSLGKKATVELTYPEHKNLPLHLKERLPSDYVPDKNGGGMVEKLKTDKKLTDNETQRVTQQEVLWKKSKLAELVRTVPGLREKPVLTVYKDEEGKLQLHGGSNDKSQSFRIPAESMGLSQERIEASGLKVGDTVDLSNVLEKGGQIPVIKKGKTMFSGTSGGNTTPKPKAAPVEETPPAEAPVAKAKPSNVVKKFLDETAKHKEVAGRLDDQLHALGGNSIADNIALQHLFKDVKKLDVKPEDWSAIYHYAEDRNAPITPVQQELYDTTIKPLQDSINTMREDMGLKPFKNDEFIHRIAQGRGSNLERFLQGDAQEISAGNVLKKTSDSMKTRTWMKIVDPENPRNTHIVSIKSPKDKLGKALGERQVTAWNEGKKTPMGALKRKVPDQVHEFFDPRVMQQLETIAKGLGIEHTRTNIPLKRGDTAAGVHYGGTNVVKTKAASPADTLLHEIGHFVDHKYDLQEHFFGGSKPKSDMIIDNQISKLERLMKELKPGTDDAVIADYKQLIQQHLEQKTINRELRDLADKRYEGFNPEVRGVKSFQKYVRTGEEKMAVMFQAYLYAPEIFRAVAPVTYDKFNNFLQSNPETKPIASIEKSLILGSDKVGDVRHEGEFIDKTGKKWKIVNATTQEIESNSNTRYYKQPLVSTAIDYMQTRQALRASQFLDKWKESPDFLYQEHSDGTTTGIAVKSDAKVIPEGWKTTTAAQFRGYHFEPRTAEVLDDFARTAAKGDPLGAFTGMNLFLRNTIFFNPLMHVPNIMWHAVMRRGASGLANPVRLARGVSSSVQAINELVHKGELYQTMLREGAPLMSFDRANLSKMIGKMMDDTIQDDKAVTVLAKLAGYANKANFIKAWYKVSSGVTWGSHDFFMLQAMIEEMKHGLTPQQAIHEVTAHIPDYRLPTRFLGSRSLKTTLSNKNVTMFLPYHYGIFKSYANTVREMAGYAPRGGHQQEGFTGRVKTSARGIDKLIMFGVIALIIYPELDKLAKKITGDNSAIQRRAGPFTIPYAIYRMLAGKRSPQSTATLVLPTPPGTKGVIQLIRNRDDLNRQIWSPGEAFSNPVQAAKDIGHFALGTIAPAQQAQRAAEGKLDGKGFVNTLLGISTPNDTKALVSKLYSQQLNLGVQTKEQQRVNDKKNAARDEIAAGKGDAKAKQLVADGLMKDSQLKDFEATAKWTPMQRTFDKLTAVNKLQVLQKTSPKDWSQLGDLEQIKKDAGKTAKSKSSSDANRTAAGDIEKILSGDTSNLMYSDGQQTTNKSVISSIGAYASAFKTSPLTAFNRIFTGQRIIRTNNGAIIVERMPVSSSQAVKGKLGGKNKSMKLDHTVPLELGGSNAESNLKLVPTDTWASYTPVEDYLGKQLAANKISAKEAQRKITAFKNGTMKSSEIIGH